MKIKKQLLREKTVYPRGGYSMRNQVMEYSSESAFEMNQTVPLVKRFHVYQIYYGCKYCHAFFDTCKIESLEPLDIKEL